jgi:hypothetical protein
MSNLQTTSLNNQDIKEILGQYFTEIETNSIFSLIDLYHLNNRPRLILACIRLSKGNYKELSSYLFHAADYCMEFIAKAESQPDYSDWLRSSLLKAQTT